MSKKNVMTEITLILLLLSVYSHNTLAMVLQTECSLGPANADYVYEMDTEARTAIIIYRDATITQKYVSIDLQEKASGKFVGTAMFSSSPSGHERRGDSFAFAYDQHTNTFEETGMAIPCK
jgi:hypothetical protein